MVDMIAVHGSPTATYIEPGPTSSIDLTIDTSHTSGDFPMLYELIAFVDYHVPGSSDDGWVVIGSGEITSAGTTNIPVPMSVCTTLINSTTSTIFINSENEPIIQGIFARVKTLAFGGWSPAIGNVNGDNIGVNIPASVIPTVTSINIYDTNVGVSSIVNAFVNGFSEIAVDVTGAASVYNATVTDIATTVNYTTVHGANALFSTNSISNGLYPITTVITDTRGRTLTSTTNKMVLGYDNPIISAFSIHRCLSDGTLNELGTYFRLQLTSSVSSLMDTAERNSLTLNVYVKPRSEPEWGVPVYSNVPSTVSHVWDTVLGTGAYLSTGSYDVRITVEDVFRTTILDSVVGSGQITMSWGPGGVGIGKVWERGALDVNGRIYDKSGLVMPVGSILDFAGENAPDGWLMCDGYPYSRTDYADLFDVIGTTFGVGDGSTTFNVPDLREKLTVGRAISGIRSVLGASGGSSSHDHEFSIGLWDNNYGPVGTNAGMGVPNNANSAGAFNGRTNTFAGSSTNGSPVVIAHANTNAATATSLSRMKSTGYTQSESSWAPYVVVNKIIKY